MRLTMITASLLLGLSSSLAASQVYKWVDAQGVTHFSAQPPQGQSAQTVNTAIAPPSGHASPAPLDQQTGESKQRSIDQAVKQQVAEEEAERLRYCTTLRTNLSQLQNNPRVRVEDKGSMRRLNEEERQARIGETKQKINDTCS